jgi:hypothetical protein
LLDLSKAIDCVVHDTVLYQLENVGIRGNALSLFKTYLCNRKQATVIESFSNSTKRIEQSRSDFKTVNVGVPQGSVLGPLIFLIYINELPKIVDELCVLFADDATLLFSGSLSNDKLEHNINNTFNIVVKWLKTINLNVNVEKTKLLQFRNYKTAPRSVVITEGSSTIEQVDNANFLGIRIDTHLNWKSHIADLNNKIAKACYALSILSDTCSENVIKSAYYGNVYSLLTYGIIYWGDSTDVVTTFRLQKRCIRTMYHLDCRHSLRDIFKEKKLLTFTGIYILELCLFVKRNGEYFTKKTSLSQKLRTQYKYNYRIPKVHNKLVYKSAFIAAMRVFNTLPIELKSLEGKQFKTHLKNWLIDRVFYNTNEFYSFKSGMY